MLTISPLYIYPIKSLGGIPLEAATLTDRGFEYDRRWMLVDENNRCLTQRELPQMTFLQVQLQENGLLIRHRYKNDPILIPFDPAGEHCTVTVWDDTCTARYVDGLDGKKDGVEEHMESIDEWFSRMLSFPCRLVYMPDDSRRKVDPNYAREEEITSFSDAFPLLIIGQASLDDLNGRLTQPLTMERFRPNIVFTGGTPF